MSLKCQLNNKHSRIGRTQNRVIYSRLHIFYSVRLKIRTMEALVKQSSLISREFFHFNFLFRFIHWQTK